MQVEDVTRAQSTCARSIFLDRSQRRTGAVAQKKKKGKISSLFSKKREKGYAVIKRFAPSAITDGIVAVVESLDYNAIFKKVFGKKGKTEYDDYRAQALFPDNPSLKKVIEFVQAKLIKNVPEMRWVPKN